MNFTASISCNNAIGKAFEPQADFKFQFAARIKSRGMNVKFINRNN